MITVLDGHALNPGDLLWDPLQAIGPCEIHGHTTGDQIVPRAREAEIVLTNKTPLSATTLAQLPKLRFIGVLATGHNVVDSAAAFARGISVANVPEYGTRTVAQHVFALLLELTNRVGHQSRQVTAGEWTRRDMWCYWDKPLVELCDLTLGVVGLGRIGRAVADLGRAFGMRVIAHSPSSATGLPLDDLLSVSDVISLHCPLTHHTERMMNAERIGKMKPTAILLNTSRGLLVDENALAEALRKRRLGGAGLDVLTLEPPCADNPLYSAPNCVITPHVAWAARAARQRLLSIAAENIKAFLSGEPRNLINAVVSR